MALVVVKQTLAMIGNVSLVDDDTIIIIIIIMRTRIHSGFDYGNMFRNFEHH